MMILGAEIPVTLAIVILGADLQVTLAIVIMMILGADLQVRVDLELETLLNHLIRAGPIHINSVIENHALSCRTL